MRVKSYVTVLSMLLIAACTRDEPPSEVVYTKRLNPYHIVKKDEALADVASKYGMTEDEVIKLNRLREPYKLFPGQRLVVHVKEDKSEEGRAAPVEEGDVAVKPLEDGAVPGDGNGLNVKTPDGETLKSAVGNVIDAVPGTSEAAASKVATPSVGTYEWPVKGDLIRGFGQKLPDGSLSEGINIRAAANLPVKATAQGVVKDAGARIPAYGNMVVLKHPDGKMSIYAHMKDVLVKPKDIIAQGQNIGHVGQTGVAKEPQLYFQMRGSDLKPIDPISMLP
jgi:lipoprotein NlpD